MLNKNKNTPSMQQIFRLKVGLFLLCLVPMLRLIWLGFYEHLSSNPIEFIERSTGFWALFILLATLALTPIRLITNIAWPIQLRRMLGLYMFFYACMHIATYLWLDFSFDLTAIIKDISKHPRILVGFAAFVLSIPLAVTSNNLMMKRLRNRWKQLHQIVYLISILVVLHFWLLVKKDIREPLLYGLVLFALLGIRMFYKFVKAKPTNQIITKI